MEVLSKLFSSTALVKILRLFLNNPETVFESKELASRCRLSPTSVRREIALLKNIDFIKQKAFTAVSEKSGRRRQRKAEGYQLNPKFVLSDALRTLLFNADPYSNDEIVRKFKNAGRVKFLIVSGVFVRQADRTSRLDLLLVG